MVDILQPTFAGGEISPSLNGRIDLAWYYNSMSLMSNFYSKKTGGAVKRAGFRFVSSSKGVGDIRLIPMQIANNIAYILELGEGYIRFYANGGIVLDDQQKPVEIATTFTAAELYDIKYTSSKDVMYLTHTSKGIFKLTRDTANSFTLEKFNYKWGPFKSDNIENIYIKSSGQTGTITLSTEATGEIIGTITYYNNATSGVTFNSNTNTISSTSETFGAFSSLQNGDSFIVSGSTSNNKSFIFSNYSFIAGVHTVLSDGTQEIVDEEITAIEGETPTVTLVIQLQKGFPSADYFVDGDVGSLIRFRALLSAEHDKWEAERTNVMGDDQPYPLGSTCTYEKNVYKNVFKDSVSGRRPPVHTEGVISDGTILWEFQHSNQGYARIISVQDARNATAEVIQTLPSSVLTPSKMFARSYFGDGEGFGYPTAISFHQGRLWLAGTSYFPEAVWSSESDNYESFKIEFPLEDDNSISLFLNSNALSRVEHLIQLGDLLALSSGAEWVIKPQGDSVLSPTSVGYYAQSNIGCSHIKPIVIDGAALYLDSSQSRIYNIGYQFESDKYSGEDITIKANHLFYGYKINDWTYAREPNDIIWMVRNDGALVALTYLPSQQVYAYHHHHTRGKFKSICSVLEGNKHKVYVAVQRKIGDKNNIYIESLEDDDFIEDDYAFFVDSGLTYDGRMQKIVTVSSGTYRDNVSITGVDFAVNAGQTIVFSDGFSVQIESIADGVAVGKPNKDIAKESEKNIIGIASRIISGLGHLEGLSVSCLGDGAVFENMIVTNGAITLDKNVMYANVGLPYDADLKTMSLELNGQLQGRKVNVRDIKLRLYKSRGVYYGSGESDLVELKSRTNEVYGKTPSLKTGDFTVAPNSKWEKNAVIHIASRQPLPLTVNLIAPNITVGGR